MNGFKLVTQREEIEQLSEELKKYSYGMEYPFVFLKEGKVIVKGELAFMQDNSVEVKLMESIQKRKGNGRVFIEYLKSLANVHEIYGEAVPEAVPFWHEMGAEFEPSVFEEYLATPVHEEGFLVPFQIAC
ncbi:hypothetical protein PP175_29050 (plasmid) [Aneurinibacillus sp. Ricciae_BoGa-3]|uniref:hypothetical protein n=1 Tax=Aneurinibacillus sp. Ricciae_BoGa-3 TaxID=3022697 RepID=UPI00234185B7|nr:hypothetical protein [Aneurinibacillus sp. Ricciae_BoGa-3]WCK57240.1 hypothetical protein PP175_29050 [Aneurinibacillus sp. Ricciae_BoGa-3]